MGCKQSSEGYVRTTCIATFIPDTIGVFSTVMSADLTLVSLQDIELLVKWNRAPHTFATTRRNLKQLVNVQNIYIWHILEPFLLKYVHTCVHKHASIKRRCDVVACVCAWSPWTKWRICILQWAKTHVVHDVKHYLRAISVYSTTPQSSVCERELQFVYGKVPFYKAWDEIRMSLIAAYARFDHDAAIKRCNRDARLKYLYDHS